MNLLIVIVISCCLPFFTHLTNCIKAESNKKQCAFEAIAVVAVVNAAVLAFWFVFSSYVTEFECLAVNGVLSALLSFVALPLIKKQGFNYIQLLKSMCLISVVLAVYSNLTFGQTGIHADTATASLLAKSQIENRSFFPDTWYYGNGDIWVLSTHTFAAPFVALMKNQSLARMLGAALICVVTACAMYYHSKKSFQNDSWVITIPVLFLFIIGDRDMILYESAYQSQMLWMLLVPAFCYKIYTKTGKLWEYAVYGVLAILLTMAGIRSMAELFLPLWSTCFLLTYFTVRNQISISWKSVFSKIVRFSISIMLPALIGLIIYRWIKATHHVINSAHNALVYADSVQTCIENIRAYVSYIFFCFGFHGGASLISLDGIVNMISVLMCLLIVFIIPVLQAVKLKEETDYVKFFFVFAVVHNMIMFMIIVLFAGKIGSQYVLTSIFASIILSSRYIYVYWISQRNFEKYVWTGLFIVASVFCCTELVSQSENWQEKVNLQKWTQQQLVDRGLTKGYADFWLAYGQEVYSDFEIRYGGLVMYGDTPTKFWWLVDGKVFEEEEMHTFLMLSEEHNQEVAPNLANLFEEPIDYFTLSGNHVYVFDYDIARDIP